MKVSVVNKRGIFSFYEVSHVVIMDEDGKVLFKGGFDAANVPSDEQTQDKKEDEGE